LPFPELEDEFYEAGMDTPPGKLKQLFFLISDRFNSLKTGATFGLTPPFITNNPAERAVLRTKTRYKLTRGFGSMRGAQTALLITQAFGEAFENGKVSSEILFS
ncbi:MAG: hypothetical protein ACP5QG_06915, partial [candidate division WOR-3 bacterium]